MMEIVRQEKMQFIADKLGKEEILTAVAEEAAELAQAALTLRRAYNGKNYTPNTDYICLEYMAEEMADLELCVDVLKLSLAIHSTIFINKAKADIKEKKLDIWVERLELNSK